MVKVTQADRVLAASLKEDKFMIDLILRGDLDDGPSVQAFARHRIATIEECAKVVESDIFAHEDCDVADHIARDIRALTEDRE